MQRSDARSAPPVSREARARTAGGHRHGRHRLGGHRRGDWHRRLLAYREVELVRSPSPDGGDAQCLLLVHVRKVVGQVDYRLCSSCAEGVITGVFLEERFRRSGLGTRALSHLRVRYPGLVWRTTVDRRLTRDLMRRMRVVRHSGDGGCRHAPADGTRVRAVRERRDPGGPSRSRAAVEGAESGVTETKESGQR
ncbi:N-acetyltransferase [Streptomyces halstedii]|uniref:N-acetyltransferase n=1 Tax=Streptomyces TaxID=1883 RepID=UPI0004A93C50|nr:N-acetyltransferase [Streptomyces sp. NTK 937]KDQ65567.1 hypothetical protein DT87_32340 [Streptomyces sp. NTK 937]WSX39637.1 N-acetyltransferase [Streptomyces halstedii]